MGDVKTGKSRASYRGPGIDSKALRRAVEIPRLQLHIQQIWTTIIDHHTDQHSFCSNYTCTK